ncbi:MAG: hypothetical protein JNL02_14345 [Saprospiraceae bacterium]|nr:hypothetical protein [Saprospiraceae bacterium]HNE28358.1 hypothetical protein [Saprospiraceae bacterium]HNL38250.1 hypothetical protein [Saprospiraceae bacterium]HNM24238.1 hypothetical protein [Saprospiraceae bacterium]
MKLCVVCHKPLSAQKQKFCSNSCKQKEHYDRLKLQTNTYHSQTIRSLIRKIKLVEMLGGKCSRCGYNANLSALHFHHRDHLEKSFKLDVRVLSNKRWEFILTEARKCDLLCANCHAEVHNPELTFENVQKIIHGASHRKRRDEQGVNSGNS